VGPFVSLSPGAEIAAGVQVEPFTTVGDPAVDAGDGIG
jgi:acyl-[acyl carrier protein]--UDP-N-acetylglucosamine O-acyltransferase